VPLLNLDDVWQINPPADRWGHVHLQLPAGVRGPAILDGSLLNLSQPLPTRVIENAARFGDLIGTGWAGGFLISPAAQAVLALFTGWIGMSIAASDDRLKGYQLLAVTGRIGKVSEYPGRLGLFVDPSTWDGSDIFKPENQRGIRMVGSAAAALRKARLRGVDVERYVGWETITESE